MKTNTMVRLIGSVGLIVAVALGWRVLAGRCPVQPDPPGMEFRHLAGPHDHPSILTGW